MSSQIKTFVTPAEYVARERQSEFKSEYLNGEVFAMTGASRKHNLVTGNAFASLREQLKNGPCEIYVSDMRVKVAASAFYTYPDVVVVCDEPQFEDEEVDTLVNPTLLIEVLSTSTERYDRIAKTSCYRTLDSLQEHLLVAQHEIRIEQYVRQSHGEWAQYEYGSLDRVVELKSIDCLLPLRDVYDKVQIDPSYRPKPR